LACRRQAVLDGGARLAFIEYLFRPYLSAEQINSSFADLVFLAAACPALVLVWSNRTKDEPHFALSQSR
jgi:ACR3 family arsenite transporter